MTTEDIASKLTYFQEQVHLFHWQTRSFSEHKATGSLYEFIQEFKDDVIEKLMGYTGKRIKGMKMEAVKSDVDCMALVDEIIKFSEELMKFAETSKYWDIANIAQTLSGEAAKTKYLLTLS